MRILIIRPGALGDTLLTFPILQHLHRKYAGSQITLVGNAAVLPLARAFGLAQESADYEEPWWGQFFVPLAQPFSRMASRLQEKVGGSDTVIFWLRAPADLLIQNARLLGIPRVFAAPGRPAEGVQMHIVTYLGQSIGEDIQLDEGWQVPATFAWQRDFSPRTTTRAVAVHPGSGGAQKCWPLERFAALIERLWQHNIPVLLLAGPADHERLTKLQELLPSPPQATLLTTLVDAPLLTVTQRLQQCRGYLGNDSGITHLAALLGLPTIALFGPSDPTIWHPVGPRVTVLHQPDLSMLTIDIVQFHLLSFSS